MAELHYAIAIHSFTYLRTSDDKARIVVVPLNRQSVQVIESLPQHTFRVGVNQSEIVRKNELWRRGDEGKP